MLSNLDIDIREGVQSLLTPDEMVDICDVVLSEEGVTRPCYVSVSVVSDDEIAQLNAQWREKNGPTDVLSLECERPDDPDLAPDEPCELGDIVLAPAYITRQAAGFGTTAADECRLLFVHGLLHLLGYDHLEDSEAEVMEAREDELLGMLHTDASLREVRLTRHKGDDDV